MLRWTSSPIKIQKHSNRMMEMFHDVGCTPTPTSQALLASNTMLTCNNSDSRGRLFPRDGLGLQLGEVCDAVSVMLLLLAHD